MCIIILAFIVVLFLLTLFILGRLQHSYFPLVYVLATNKHQSTYEKIFRELLNIEPQLNPKHIMVDFEKAAINAASNIFQKADLHGCFFHFGQCVWRHIQSVGLQQMYNNDDQFAWHMKHLIALAFVPVTNVIVAFETLADSEFFLPNENSEWNEEIQK